MRPSPSGLALAERPVQALRGVGPRLAERLAEAGLRCWQDLWFHLPLRYEDRTRITPLADLLPGRPVQVVGRVVAVERGFRSRPQLKVLIAESADGPAQLTLRFFHFRSAQLAQFSPGRRILVYGEPRGGLLGYEMVHPSYRLLDEQAELPVSDSLDPIYPAIAGVGSAVLARLIADALGQISDAATIELLPTAVAARLGGATLHEALLAVHRPGLDADVGRLLAGTHPAQRRLASEELLAHHLSVRRQRQRLQSQGAMPLPRDHPLLPRLLDQLPFALTAAQRRVVEEISADLARDRPMLRLVQGDVGSGKTVVAALAALAAIGAGAQAALVAPTELLAEQHLRAFRDWFAPLGIEIAWLAGKVTGKARTAVLQRIASGEAKLVVGTHALMQSSVNFAALALCIVDEQHRFGVHQRLALRDKGHTGKRIPHQLVMTATPIPRTLAMTAYADLDVSRIDQLPPGRTPVRTVALSNERRDEVIERIRHACQAGAQAYWVCTVIEDSDEVQAQAAESTYRQLCEQLPELRIGLVHGRLKPKDKSALMAAFKNAELDLLVSTTVIEVGVDVPNASLMLIENAERLGLAQLHQLRGRVGRGAAVSSCVLLYQSPLSMMARSRLETMRETNDGFVIAERDLQLRGPGEVLGTRQTGLAQFRIADLERDADLLEPLAQLGEQLQAEHPERVDPLIRRWIGAAVHYAGV